MKTDRKYIFELKIGIEQFVKVTHVKDNIVTGLIFEEGSNGKKTWNPYSATFNSMQNDIAKISILKFNPYITGAIVVGVLIATGFIIRDNYTF